MKKQMHPEIPAAKKLTADARRSCRIAALAVLAGAVLLTVLLAASPAAREAVVPVPAGYAQTLTKGMVSAIAWKVLFFAGSVLLAAAFVLRRRSTGRIENENSLHEAEGTDTGENRSAFRSAGRARRTRAAVRAGAVLMLLFIALLGFGIPVFFLLVPVPLVLLFLSRKTDSVPMPDTPAAKVFETTNRYSGLLLAAAAAAVLTAGAVLTFCSAVGFLANRQRESLNSTANNLRKAIVYWQEQCAEAGTPCELPSSAEDQHGSDSDPDSLTKQIRQYFTDVDKIGYYRVLSENGTVTDVLISQRPITDTAVPDGEKQRALLSSPFTRDLAVGSARAFADD